MKRYSIVLLILAGCAVTGLSVDAAEDAQQIWSKEKAWANSGDTIRNHG